MWLQEDWETYDHNSIYIQHLKFVYVWYVCERGTESGFLDGLIGEGAENHEPRKLSFKNLITGQNNLRKGKYETCDIYNNTENPSLEPFMSSLINHFIHD